MGDFTRTEMDKHGYGGRGGDMDAEQRLAMSDDEEEEEEKVEAARPAAKGGRRPIVPLGGDALSSGSDDDDDDDEEEDEQEEEDKNTNTAQQQPAAAAPSSPLGKRAKGARRRGKAGDAMAAGRELGELLTTSLESLENEAQLAAHLAELDRVLMEMRGRRSLPAHARSLFGLAADTAVVPGAVDRRYAEFCVHAEGLSGRLLDLFGRDSAQRAELGSSVVRGLAYVHGLRNMLLYEAEASSYAENSHGTSLMPDVHRFQPPTEAKLSKTTASVVFLLEQAHLRGLRRKGSWLFEEHVTPAGHHTHAYKPYSTIEHFAYAQSSRSVKFDQFQNLVDGNATTIVRHLTACVDPLLPDLVVRRDVTSWGDGIYFADTRQFLPYEDPLFRSLPPDVIACKRFQERFDTTAYDNIVRQSPSKLLKVLHDQGFETDDELIFILGLIGRVIHEVGALDTWEVAPFLFGMAGTGKSSVLDVACSFFEVEDVVALGNRIEKNFGLQSTIGKLFFVAPDIKHNFQLDAGDLQTMISGDLTPVNKKYEVAETVRWITPFLMAGNELPTAWRDKLGALLRRIIVVPFDNVIKVENRDDGLKRALQRAPGANYRLCNECYHILLARVKAAGGSLRQMMPPRIERAQEVLTQHGNPLQVFLSDANHVRTTDDKALHRRIYTHGKAFMSALNQYCVRHNLRPPPVVPKDLERALKPRGVVVRHCERLWPREGDDSRPRSGTYLLGLELLDADDDDDADQPPAHGYARSHPPNNRRPSSADAADAF